MVITMLIDILIFPITVIAMGFIAYKRLKQAEEEKRNEVVRLTQKEDLYWNIDMGTHILFVFSCFVLLFAFLIKFKFIIPDIGLRIGEINNIIFNIDVAAVTLALTLIFWDRKYYLCFSIKEILVEENFYNYLKSAIITCFLINIFTIYLLESKMESLSEVVIAYLFETIVICNIVLVGKVFQVELSILFSNKRKELKLLKKLYRIHNIMQLDIVGMKEGKNWKKNELEIHFEYLLNEYIKCCKKLRKQNIQWICFEEVKETNYERWEKRVSKRCVSYIWIIGIISCVNIFVPWDKTETRNILVLVSVWVINIIIGIAVWVITRCKNKQVQKALFEAFGDKKGFVIKGKREILLPMFSIGYNNKYMLYSQSINNMIGFLKIALHNEVNMKLVSNVMEEYFTKANRLVKNKVDVFPYFIWAYMLP